MQEAERRANSLITDVQQREADLLNQADVLKQNKSTRRSSPSGSFLVSCLYTPGLRAGLSFEEQEQLLERLEKSLHSTIVVALKLLEEKFNPYFLELHGEVNTRIKAPPRPPL